EVILDYQACTRGSFGNQPLNLIINQLGRIFRELFLVHHTLHHHAFFYMEDLIAQLAASHTLIHYHFTSEFGGLLQVGPSTSSDPVVAIFYLFGNTPTKHSCQDIFVFDNTMIT